MPELWCVAMNNANSYALQATLDWACGPGGADCGSIQQGGPCYDAGDILTMASYAFNDYFLTHGHGSCKFPSSFTVKNGSFTGQSTIAGIYPANLDISGGSYFPSTWWILTKDGKFFANSAWQALRLALPKVPWAKSVWFPHHVPRWAFIECIAFMGRLSEQVA
ncbi:hypothetical protein RHSIM_RhsimUnG0244600 [Rhododendron simsii]|uniref:X8 domain-containing protein n=1 Tax=Rhododendron simsii TaxID=118357 RepID=A0A834FV55_RHOSS|nr:hypothetical protein RHSIM_RhsimUnG0244600 [Rhododendron simsii]